ncbi:hypothetical protein F2Q70_00000588 [Brassica cretica]|uniref:pectinesterase n=1 Tax=Brassica cretica TaxID=69181 RepID=A0A8S9IRV3_BRACR|nr:hypothetical protein F2Q70_00000588 [Brassica cretica]
MDSPKLPHSLSTSSSTPLASSAVKPHRKKLPPRTFILITIAVSAILLLLLTLILYATVSKSSHNSHNTQQQPPPPPTAQIRLACNATRFPDHCFSSLSKPGLVPQDPKPVQIIHSAISVSYESLKSGQSQIKSILDSSAGDKNRTNIATICLEILSYSQHRTESSDIAVTSGGIKDARAWMSAALAYQYDCWSGLKTVNDTKQVVDTITFLNDLVKLTGAALSMMVSFDNFGDDVVSWIQPATERDGFWEKTEPSLGPVKEVGLSFPSGLKEDVTVCKDGGKGCGYKTVQEAVDAAPESNGDVKFVIGIREGVYEETVRVPFEKKNVVFIGDGMGKAVITGSLNVGQPGMTTYNSATVGVLGDGFMARDLTIENTAGADAHQAVAFRSDSDFSILENCELLGNQDTLYAHSLRQFYKQCRIQGNVDFIFGNSAAVFQDCDILIASKHSKLGGGGANNVITAHGRIDAAQSTGFGFSNCSVNGTEEYMKEFQANPKGHRNYLGRPWKEFSRTVFVNCDLESLISPDGWMPWSGDFALKTLYYGEYKNTGTGSVRSKRVPWSSEIPEKHVDVYSVANFIQADEWPSMPA